MTALLDVFGGILLALILFGMSNLQSWLERWDQERHFRTSRRVFRYATVIISPGSRTSAPSAG